METVNQTLTYVIFTVMTAVAARVLRELSRMADANRARTIQLATELRLATYRFHIHNATGLLAQLSRDDTPADMLVSLRQQAAQEADRLRNEVLTPVPTPTDAEGATLGEIVTRATASFGHLPLEVRAALGRQTHFAQEQALIIETALISLLYNVQFHANASEVVVHTDCDTSTWQVSVADNGAGFNPDHTKYGFGLRNQVLNAAEHAGMHVEIVSHIGEGTRVTISGPRPPLG